MKLRRELLPIFMMQTDAENGDPEKFFVRDLEAVLKNENEFNHFLVLSKICNSEESKSVYTADFWVNVRFQ
ncbi:MAG TPA: hypothetical protein PL048_02025 [Leptospiraceae bacterium]|nr:hypothetical protein [Leptospiraceae bacterium]